jgi:hypothetical protein
MPKKPKPEEPPPTEESVLVTAAKSIGATAGKIAHLAGAKPDSPKSAAKGKLPKKNKTRLPRRQKKALRKSGAPTA